MLYCIHLICAAARRILSSHISACCFRVVPFCEICLRPSESTWQPPANCKSQTDLESATPRPARRSYDELDLSAASTRA